MKFFPPMRWPLPTHPIHLLLLRPFAKFSNYCDPPVKNFALSPELPRYILPCWGWHASRNSLYINNHSPFCCFSTKIFLLNNPDVCIFSEKRGRNGEKPPAAEHRQWRVGPRPPHPVLGVSPKRPAGADHHQAGRVSALRSGKHLQGCWWLRLKQMQN